MEVKFWHFCYLKILVQLDGAAHLFDRLDTWSNSYHLSLGREVSPFKPLLVYLPYGKML